MIKTLLLTGQADAAAGIFNFLLGALALVILIIGSNMGRIPARDLRLTFLVSVGISQVFVLMWLPRDRAYELKYSTYNGSWLGDWLSEMISGTTPRGPSGSISGLNACLGTWALMVLCLAIAQRWGRRE